MAWRSWGKLNAGRQSMARYKHHFRTLLWIGKCTMGRIEMHAHAVSACYLGNDHPHSRQKIGRRLQLSE